MSNLLFISNWPFEEGLTQATIIPHLQILNRLARHDQVFFSSLETKPLALQTIGAKVQHVPFVLAEHRFRLWDRYIRWKKYTAFLLKLVRTQEIDLVMARGAAAGIIAYRLFKETGIAFYVESFEPHADYMASAGIWKTWDPRYIVQKRGEQHIKKKGAGLMPVSNQYRDVLLREGLQPEKVKTIPCNVPIEAFAFDRTKRDVIRQRLGITDKDFTGIYVGKLGGLYYDEAAWKIWKTCFDIWPDFQLIWLTPQDQEIIAASIRQYGLPVERVHVMSVPHAEVPAYLSAADFAFSLHRSTSVSAYFSPIKNGEYWANGLPVIITEGVGDDAEIVRSHRAGLVLEKHWPSGNLSENLAPHRAVLERRKDNSIEQLASEFRSFEITERVYRAFGII